MLELTSPHAPIWPPSHHKATTSTSDPSRRPLWKDTAHIQQWKQTLSRRKEQPSAQQQEASARFRRPLNQKIRISNTSTFLRRPASQSDKFVRTSVALKSTTAVYLTSTTWPKIRLH
ncbi:hypothetical protein [Parasitella parasitica]|uniref:Uncharacterized protein n=1 Tax=Parasitella parasitica TaxID=35722 RepID=A0A0B7N7F6_9FUNG|nr:hypothetical protein [Parasitella parasitica]